MVVKFTFQSVFGNSLQNPRHFSARGREESLELYSILWSDWPTSKQEVLRHGNRFVARVRRRYFSEREKRRPEMRLRFAGYVTSGRRKNSKIFRELPGIQYIFPLHHVNKPDNFQRGNYKSSSFEIDLFSVRSNTAAKLPLIRPYFSSRCAVFFVAILNSYE